MSLEQVRNADERTLERVVAAALEPGTARSGPPGGWLRLAVMRFYAGAMLRRTLGRPERIHIEELSPHMLRDIGWPPE